MKWNEISSTFPLGELGLGEMGQNRPKAVRHVTVQRWKNFDDKISRFGTIPMCDGGTGYARTDRIAIANNACISERYESGPRGYL